MHRARNGEVPMKITYRQAGDVTILDLEGKLTHGSGDVELRQAILEALEDGSRKILINLGGVRTIDSSGLGELIRCKVTGERHGATLALLNADLKTYRLLTTTRLVGVFDMYDSEEEAVGALGS